MNAAVVLAAGASTRLGQAKQRVVLAGETLLERAVRTAREAGCAPVVVVLGAEAREILADSRLGDAKPVVNAGWAEGMASSIRAGVRSLEAGVPSLAPGVQGLQSGVKKPDGVVLMACDQPAVTAAHLRLLMAAGEVTASRYAGRNGVPAYFPAAVFAELMTLRGDAGARDLLQGAAAVDLADGDLDVDVAADLARARLLFP